MLKLVLKGWNFGVFGKTAICIKKLEEWIVELENSLQVQLLEEFELDLLISREKLEI